MVEFWSHLLWLLSAGLLGLLITAVFAGRFKLSRPKFLIPYVGSLIIFIGSYILWSKLNIFSLIIENWIWGVIAGFVVGGLLVKNVMSQSSPKAPIENNSILDYLWLGLTYGIIDSLFLNILPVLMIWKGFSLIGWTTGFIGWFFVSCFGLIASLFVTALYHLGYPEFRNKKLILVLIGNTVITLAYLISLNPLGAIISHTLMHVAAVYKGPETTVQLPPHY